MKKIFLASLFLVVAAGLATATPLTATCFVLTTPNSSTIAANTTCTVNADAGDVINTISFSAFDDVTGVTGTPSVSYAGTLSQTTNLFGISVFCGGPTTGLPCNDTVTGSVASGLSLATYSVNFATASNVVTGAGTISGASVNLSITATETPSGATPEPATLTLMGAGLLGLGLLSRRRAVRK